MTYEMQLTPRTTVVLQKLRVRPCGYILAQKKVTKTAAVTADHTCTPHLHSVPVCSPGRAPAAPGGPRPRAVPSCDALQILPRALSS